MVIDSTINSDVGITRAASPVLRTQMRPIVTDGVALSVGLSVTVVSPAKTAEPIEMPFGLRTGAQGITH